MLHLLRIAVAEEPIRVLVGPARRAPIRRQPLLAEHAHARATTEIAVERAFAAEHVQLALHASFEGPRWFEHRQHPALELDQQRRVVFDLAESIDLLREA